MRRIRLLIEYDGSDFHGWQIQPNVRTVQGELQVAVLKMIAEAVVLRGASRTDAGVHARGQVAHFDTTSVIEAGLFARGLTALTERDVAVIESTEAPLDFSARHDARGKTYRYRIWNSVAPSPLERRWSWHVRKQLDTDAMRAGAEHLRGEHDFAAFRSAGCDALTTTRDIRRLQIDQRGCLLEITVEGTAFLQHMVRIIVGTLVDVGKGKLEADDVARIRDALDRSRAGQTAPPRGLCLNTVHY